MSVNRPQQFQQLRGLALPALRGVGGYFASKNRSDVAWGDLILALFRPIGGTPMRRTMGSPLFEVLFEPNVGQQQDKIDFIIREVAEDQLPHITIQEVAIVQDERNVQVHISFLSTEDTELATRSIEVSKTAEVKTLAARFVS